MLSGNSNNEAYYAESSLFGGSTRGSGEVPHIYWIITIVIVMTIVIIVIIVGYTKKSSYVSENVSHHRY
jgi:hypothetical protein